VHSLKDVPSIIPDDFILAGFLERGDPRDAWVQLDRVPPGGLPSGAVVGTSAPRRRAQFRSLFPHLALADMRGNVDTRINKLRAGLYDAAVLAGAGLKRLGRESEIVSLFAVDEMIPAAGQGIVGIETLRSHTRAREAAGILNHPPTARAALAERGVLQKFGNLLDCYSAVAVHATIGDDATIIRTFFGELEGDRSIRILRAGKDDATVVNEVYDELVAKGAMALAKATA
jgi:hydroxymethylbilane synthase